MNKASIIRMIVSVALIAVIGFVVYVNDFYHADQPIMAAMSDVEGVDLLEKEGQYVFVPEEITAGLIFYPGGKVEAESYIPLMVKFAEQGILCVLTEMPGNLAVLSIHGSEDGVLNQKKFEDNLTNLPVGYRVEVLEGGNHAQFGAYGMQDKDGVALISREEQMTLTADLFTQMLPLLF